MKKTFQNILVLGAKSDIAAATARLYAEQSCALTLVARQTESLEKLKEDQLLLLKFLKTLKMLSLLLKMIIFLIIKALVIQV